MRLLCWLGFHRWAYNPHFYIGERDAGAWWCCTNCGKVKNAPSGGRP
jgi:hypothetical protein